MLARSFWLEQRRMQAKIDKLERKMAGQRNINKAQAHHRSTMARLFGDRAMARQ